MITSDQIISQLVYFGVPVEDARILAAVAYGESGYNAGAENLSDIEESIGLFQINTWAHGPKLEIATGSYNKEDWFTWLKDPINNISMAAQVYKSQGLGAWTQYTNGNYQNYFSQNMTSETGGNLPDTAGPGNTETIPGEVTGSVPWWKKILSGDFKGIIDPAAIGKSIITSILKTPGEGAAGAGSTGWQEWADNLKKSFTKGIIQGGIILLGILVLVFGGYLLSKNIPQEIVVKQEKEGAGF